jgi:hypothetical protein
MFHSNTPQHHCSRETAQIPLLADDVIGDKALMADKGDSAAIERRRGSKKKHGSHQSRFCECYN